MATIRVNKNKNYTVMSNYHLRDKNLSLKAVGLLSKMLSLPEGWDYSVLGLVSICKENKTAVQNTLKELEEHKYLKRTKTHDKYGRIDYIYDIYESPFTEESKTEKPQTENLCTVNPCTDNVPQLNTNKSNTEKLNTNKKKVSKAQSYDEQIERYTDNENLRQALKAFIQMRQLIKKPLTNYALSLILNKLSKLSDNDETKTDIVNQSVEHSWQGVFELKTGYTNKSAVNTEPKEETMLPPLGQDFYKNGKFDLEGYNDACKKYNEWLARQAAEQGR